MKLGERVEPQLHRRAKRILEIECDRCHRRYDTAYSAKYAVQVHHFCSRRCSQAEHRHLWMPASRTPKAQAKREETTKARFGVVTVLQLPHVHALANTPEKCRQRHETMKRNGSYFNSKPEHAFYAWLSERFGVDDVVRQPVVNQWPIDFHVKSIDTYMQFDGEYWHGLDRTLEEISKFKTPRDRTILLKYQIDRKQDAWFQKHGLKLVRVTDKQFARGETLL